MKIRNDYQNKLKAYRTLKGMTLETVAKKIGVNKTTIQRYESGVIPNIPIETVKALSSLYGVSVYELLDIKLNANTRDLFIEFIESLDFNCIFLSSEDDSTTSSSEIQSSLSLRIQTPSGDEYEVSHDDLICLKSDLQSYLEYQFFKLSKKK